ncbi:MAG: RNA-binding S4 domain-containing protein [Acholeplasmataceae bacterium]|jgi:ribosomal 50S subunit-recycling heat shock protein
MRLDKFLKLSRLIKRRTVAKEAADNNLISINGKVAKPSSSVDIGDILKVALGTKIREIKVLSLNQNEEMFIILKEEKRF